MSNQAKRFELVKDFDDTIEAEASILDTIADDIKSAAFKYNKLAVVINNCYGGFELSPKAIALYKELSGKEFSYDTPRHDINLVRVVMMLGTEANSDSDLRIVELSNSQYFIQEYDGAELVKCPEDIEWKHAEPEYGQLYNPYDGNTYKTVKIGEQTWMAEDLGYCMAGLHFIEDTAEYPDGWHVPGVEDFEQLLQFVGSDEETRSDNLRAACFENGKDLYGFSACDLFDSDWIYLGWSYYLCADHSKALYITKNKAHISEMDKENYDYGWYVRLVKDKEDI